MKLLKCQVIPCDQNAVAKSLLGVPVCLHHGRMLGGYRVLPGFEKIVDLADREIERTRKEAQPS